MYQMIYSWTFGEYLEALIPAGIEIGTNVHLKDFFNYAAALNEGGMHVHGAFDVEDEYCDAVWGIVIDRFYNDVIIQTYVEEISKRELFKVATKIKNVFIKTAYRYLNLISNLKAIDTKLFDKVVSSTLSTNRFNDTPQEGGSFEDDAHTTNYAEASTTTSSDFNTPMTRFNEVYQNFRNILRDWSEEFHKLFIDEWED